MFILLFILFALSLVCIDTSKPELRLIFLAIIPVIYFYKTKIDKRLNELSLNKKALRVLMVIVLLGLTLRVGHSAYRLSKSEFNMEDIAHVHLRAIPLLFVDKKNPYTEAIDHYPVETVKGTVDYAGLKYPPLGLFFYAPFIAIFGDKGIYVANAILYFLSAFLIFKSLALFSKFHAYLGLLFFLSADFYFRLALNRGTNDFLPSILMLMGLLALKNNQDKKCGLYFGFSLLAKQFPIGLILMICALQKRWSAVFIATTVFLVGILPFVFWDAKSLFDNMIYFNLVRPVRGSSIIQSWSPLFQSLVPLLGLGLVALLAFIGNWKKRLLLVE